MNRQWDSDPNRAQRWNHPGQQQAPPHPPPPGTNAVPGFFPGWTSPPVPPPFFAGWAPGTNLPPQGTWMPMQQFMAHNNTSTRNNTSTAGYANPAYYPPHIPLPPYPMSSNMTSNGGPAPSGPAPGGPAPGGQAPTIPSDLENRSKAAQKRARKKLRLQQQNGMQSQMHHEAQQQFSQQQYPQQYQAQTQVQMPPQAPRADRKHRPTKQQMVKMQKALQQQQQQQTQSHDQQEPQQYQLQPQAQQPPPAPNAFPQTPASLPAKPKNAKARKKRALAAAATQLQPLPQQNPIPGFNPTPTFTPLHHTPPQHHPHPNRAPLRPLNRDPISAPSAASGGIPDPTPAYLTQAALPPRRAREHQPLLVIIDLNGTLLHRPSPRNPTTFVERPGARAFLQECLDAFYVVIWSSARADNVAKMVRQLLPEASQRARLLATWGRDRFGLSAADYNQRTQCYKRLTSVWRDAGVAAAHPLPGGRWGQENTVLIDDSAEKARSEPFNAVTLPEFTGRTRGDEVLGLVHEYLCVLSMQADVSAFVRTHPFEADRERITEYARSVAEAGEVEEKAADGDETEDEEAKA